MHVHPDYAPLFREIGLDAEGVFADDRVRVWRSLADRENATLDADRADGSAVRLHVKRYPPTNGTAAAEVAGHRLLAAAGLPTAPLAAHGRLDDGRSFVLFADLAGYTPADQWLRDPSGPGWPLQRPPVAAEAAIPDGRAAFERLLAPTADLAARLHAAGLHHRDLYLCHFMVRPDPFDLRLIDVARVARLANPLTRRRWVVKDLAQFWYSTTKLAVTDDQRDRWLARYAERRGLPTRRWAGPVRRKAAAIGRHDVRLNERQPARNISIPTR